MKLYRNEPGAVEAEVGGALAILPYWRDRTAGPHLPTGTDFFTVGAVARGAAQQMPEEIPSSLRRRFHSAHRTIISFRRDDVAFNRDLLPRTL